MARVLTAVAFVAAVGVTATVAAQRSRPVVEVYKSPTCGCCRLWVQHLEKNGFAARVTDVDDLVAIKTKLQVPARAQSCHTAVVDGYLIEGHVPAADVQRLLKERPALRGLAVPGMPIGSPGMEAGTTVQRYDVLAITREGRMTVYASYGR